MIAEGIYKGKATDWGWMETSGGNPQFGMGFDVVGRNRPRPPSPWPIPSLSVEATRP